MNPFVYLLQSIRCTGFFVAVAATALLLLNTCDRKESTNDGGDQSVLHHDEAPNDEVGATGRWIQRELTRGSEQRSFLTYAPASFEAEGDAVVLFAHGYGDNARALARSLPIESWVAEHGFVAVVPFADRNPEDADGGRTSWNAGACCAFGDQARDDLGFIKALIDRIRSEHPSKELTFYLIGFSNGGFLAETVACRHPDWFRGVSSIGGSLSTDQPPCETPTTSVRVHRVTGAIDERISRTGGQTPLGPYASFDDDFVTWSAALECPEHTTDTTGPATCQTSSCNGGAVRFCLIDGLRHQWPASPQFSYDAFDDAWHFWTM